MGGRLASHADKFRADILRAYRWNQARTPVWPLYDGLCIPAYSGMLYGFGTTGEMIPGEDGNRSWAYDVELGAPRERFLVRRSLERVGRDVVGMRERYHAQLVAARGARHRVSHPGGASLAARCRAR